MFSAFKRRFVEVLGKFADPELRDRGEIVPTAIIYAIAAIIAVALLAAVSDYVTGWIGIWPDAGAPAPAP